MVVTSRDPARHAADGPEACPHPVVCLPAGPLPALEAACTSLAGELPRLDVLVLNASAYYPTPTAEITARSAHELFDANALAPLIIARAFSPLLRRSSLPGGGAIVGMADVHAMGPAGRPRAGYVAYSMSKAAMLEMLLSLARELAPAVRVNAVAPGVVAFPESGPESDPAEQAAYLRRVPLARAGTPEDAAEAVAFLALRARYTTGHVLRCDGGRSIT